MELTPNLLDLIDDGFSVREDHLGPCVGDDDTADDGVTTNTLELGPSVGDDVEELSGT